MSNFTFLGCLELKLHILTLFRVKLGRGGGGDPNFFLQIYFSWVEIILHIEFHLPGLPRSGRFIKSLTLFKARVSLVEISFHVEFHPPGLP